MIELPESLRLTVDAVTLAAWATALNNLYLGLLAWWEGRSLVVARLFAALAVVAAWWSFWLGLAYTEVVARAPTWFHTSQLLSGFAGPLLYLFIRFQAGLAHRWRWRHLVVLLPEGFGTLVYLAERLWMPPGLVAELVTYFQTGGEGELAHLAAAIPWWYLALQWLHAAQLFGFFLAAFGVPKPDPAACAHAVDAAFGLLQRLAGIVPEGAGHDRLRLGLGIHYGPIRCGIGRGREPTRVHRLRRHGQHGQSTRGLDEGDALRSRGDRRGLRADASRPAGALRPGRRGAPARQAAAVAPLRRHGGGGSGSGSRGGHHPGRRLGGTVIPATCVAPVPSRACRVGAARLS